MSQVNDIPAAVAALPAEHHRAQRSRRLRLAVISSLITRPIGFLLPLLTLPLFLNYLGRTRLGMSDTATEFASYLGITNLGLSITLINKLADCMVHNDEDRARRYVSSLTIAIGGIVVIGGVVWSIVSFAVPWHTLVRGVEAGSGHELAISIWLAGLFVLLGSPASIPPSIYSGYQETHRSNVWEVFTRLFTLAACFGVTYTAFGVPGVIVASIGTATLLRLLNLATLFTIEKPWLFPRWRDFDRTIVMELLSQSLLLLGIQVSMGLVFQSSKMIISSRIGLDAVVPFGTLQKLFTPFYGLIMLLIVPLWAATSEAIRRGDIAWVRKSLRLTSIIGPGFMLAVGAALFALGEHVSQLPLIGKAMTGVTRPMIAAFALLFAIRAWSDCRSVVLNSMEIIAPQVWLYLANGIVNIVLGIALAPRFGLTGVAWAMTISCLVTTFGGYPWLVRKHFSQLGSPASPKVATP